MAATAEYIDIKDAKKAIVKILKDYGSLGYSRLLMLTAMPEEILGRCLELLLKDQIIEREGDVDPQYRLASRGMWPFS